jgi:flavin-dependent dehydrogenase
MTDHPPGGQVRRFTDVLIVGGGPAGSSAATLLARHGVDATVLERERFPRYHIGESLLLSCWPLFDTLGVSDSVLNHGFVRKHGVHIDWGTDTWDVRWGNPREASPSHAFQVVRSEFDDLLLRHAERQGARVEEETEVSRVEFGSVEGGRVHWRHCGSSDDGVTEFRHLIDASGRYGLLSNHHARTRRHLSGFENVAVWTYWKEVNFPACYPPGAIVVNSVPDGWVWAIPLHDGTASVGLVVHKHALKTERASGLSLKSVYERGVLATPQISRMLDAAACVGSVRTEQDFSYYTDQLCGPSYFIAGDAACFIDPLLSSGVHLATYSAVLAAACILSMGRGELSQDDAYKFYSAAYNRAYWRFVVLVAALYQEYHGVDSLFWQAQRLAHDPIESTRLDEAFSNVISGIDDWVDAATGSRRTVVDEVSSFYRHFMNKAGSGTHPGAGPLFEPAVEPAIARALNAGRETATSPQTAVDGMYLGLHSPVGIMRVPQAMIIRSSSSTVAGASAQPAVL